MGMVTQMNDVLQKNWPQGLSKTLTYRLGEIPLHEYVIHNAQDMPTQTAYNFYGNEISWQQLNDSIDRLAQFLKTQGITKGDCVGLYLQNSPQYIIGHYAIQRIGAIVVPINAMLKDAELAYIVSESGLKSIIVGQELYHYVEKIKTDAPTLQSILTTSYTDYLPEQPTLPFPEEYKLEKQYFDGAYDLVQIINDTPPLQEKVAIDLWKDVALLAFTSGTSGRPKGAMLTHGNALFKTAANVHANGMQATNIMLTIAPLSHIAGMLMGVNLPIYSGCQTLLLTRFDAIATLNAIEQYHVTTWYSIAPMNAGLLTVPGIERRNLSSLKINLATSFGIAVTEQLADKWKAVTNGCLLFEAAYGLSETHTGDTFMPQHNIKYGSCGIPSYYTDMKIIDPATGEEVPPGAEGEVILKNPGVFKGYLNYPEETAKVLRDGWLYTGDVGKIDEDGYLFYLGRMKEMIKCSGYSVFPDDVEALLSRHPAVQQSVVVGVPDPKRGESVKAFVVLKPDFKGKVETQEMVEWARDNMAVYKYPREVEFLEALPTTSSGKILRRLLKEDKD